MFIYSVKANTLKFVAVIGAAIITLAAIILLIPEYAPKTTAAIAAVNAEYRYDKIRSNEDRVAFLEQFGWKVESTPIEEVTMKIPSEFDKVMNTYNELQKKGGLDLSKYRGREVTRYSYNVTNYPDYEGKVTANVIVYKNRVIGGDVSSSDVTGFIGTFEYPTDIQGMTGEADTHAATEAPAESEGE